MALPAHHAPIRAASAVPGPAVSSLVYQQDPTPPPLSPQLLATFPTSDQTTTLISEYLNSLHPTKRAKALLSVSFLQLIHSILASPTSTSISDAQTRFWARRQFVLSPASPSPASAASQNIHQRVCHHSSLLPLAPAEHLWRILTEAHARVGHVGRDRTVREVQRQWAGVPKEVVGRYVKACPGCRGVRKVGGPSERKGKRRPDAGEGDDDELDAEGEDDEEATSGRLSSATPTPRMVPARPPENVLGLSVTSPRDRASSVGRSGLLSYPPDPSHLHPFSPHPGPPTEDQSPSMSARSMSPEMRRSVAPSIERSSVSVEPASPLQVLADVSATASALPSAPGPSVARTPGRAGMAAEPSSARVPHFSSLVSSFPTDNISQHGRPGTATSPPPGPTSLPSPYALGLLPAPYQESSESETTQSGSHSRQAQQHRGQTSGAGSGSGSGSGGMRRTG